LILQLKLLIEDAEIISLHHDEKSLVIFLKNKIKLQFEQVAYWEFYVAEIDSSVGLSGVIVFKYFLESNL
jgi:hypothetical protein